MIEKVMKKMMEYDHGDPQLINHFLKVYGYAAMIGRMEGLDERTQKVLDIAALLHDIGIKISLEKYGNCDGPHQEYEGPFIARELLAEFSLDREMTERICYLIAHHHTYHEINGMDYQILVEADFLVNLDEGKAQAKEISSVRERIFQTKSGKEMLDLLFEKMIS